MGAQQHAIEYAKSGRAKCHGAPPCKGSFIPQGALRHGNKAVSDAYGETTLWRHWECVTSQILKQLAHVSLEQVPGFRTLTSIDQNRVRQDVKAGRIAPLVLIEPSYSQTPSSQKRKADNALTQSSTQPSQSAILTQDEDEVLDNAEDKVKDELYISLPTSIVGVQYYRGMVGPFEEVALLREPDNQYDINAIQVLNISRQQVGHIPRNVASKLSPLIDRGQVTVEGVIHEGNLSSFQYSISMTLRIYGASNKRTQLEPLLIWATPRQKGFTDAMRPAGYQSRASRSTTNYSHSIPPSSAGAAGPSRLQPATGFSAAQRKAQEDRTEALQKAAELRQIINSLEKVNDEGRRSSLLDTVCDTNSQALQFCVEREYPSLPQSEADKPVQFWQYRSVPGKPKGYYLNIATHTPQEAPPVLGRGGLMADSMGLGKTLTMLALIIATKKDVPKEYSNTTLIVVPLSVLSNWKTQISDHCTPGTVSSHMYYDVGRDVAPEHLTKFDIVITTYQVVAQDFSAIDGIKSKVDQDGKAKKKKKKNGGLFGLKWKRVIVDETHTIRNPKTKMATAIRNLDAERRWAVTGTPIINSPKDLGSLLQFLQICKPIHDEAYFKRLLLRPLAQGAPEGAELLRALMSHICIRRTKEMQNSKGEYLVPLPPVEMTLIPVRLDPAARAIYDEVETLSQQRFASYVDRQGGSGITVPANVLSLLTRLRQLALHSGLVPSDYLEQLRRMADEGDKPTPTIQITPQERIKIQSLLLQAIEDNEECPICFSVPADPRMTSCRHLFCYSCISEIITRDPKCPMDRRLISTADLIEPPPPTDLTQAIIKAGEDEDVNSLRAGSSAKCDQLLQLLQLTPKTDKSLVFSQFTGFLDKIGQTLDEKGIPYVRFDGRISARKRQDVLDRFNVPLEEDQDNRAPEFMMPTKRPRHSTTRTIMDEEDESAQDDDFVQSDDDSFLDNSEDDSAWTKRKGKGQGQGTSVKKRRSAALKEHTRNPVVMLISLKAGALGLNLTVANHVYLMDPWWQEGIESQAIDRCNRIGQTKPVHIYQLVAENTVEAKVLDIQERKKKIIKQAFSGIKTTETHRQKKESRLHDLIELFGVRREALSSIT